MPASNKNNHLIFTRSSSRHFSARQERHLKSASNGALSAPLPALLRAMYNVNAQRQIARKELKEGLEGQRSWHHQYKDSAYVYIGGLHEGLTEGLADVFLKVFFGACVSFLLFRWVSRGEEGWGLGVVWVESLAEWLICRK